jgi:uncharacterized membrane protein
MTVEDGNAENEEKETRTSRKILMLFVVGLLTVVAGVVVLIISTVLYGGAQTSFGTVIFIGPIPIVIGAGPGLTWIILVAIALVVLTIVLSFMMRGESKKGALHES